MQSALLTKAFNFAMENHSGQTRKASKEKVPYLSHVLGAASIAIEIGGDEDIAAATMLHDVVEDVESVTLKTIADEFGQKIADIVGALSEDKSLSWEKRKAYAREKICMVNDAVFIAKCADVLHNTRGMLLDFPVVDWTFFKRGVLTTVNNYCLVLEALDASARVFRQHLSPTLHHRLEKTLQELQDVRGILEAAGAAMDKTGDKDAKISGESEN
jgi:hypothetical protein